MNVTSAAAFPSNDRVKNILKEVESARQAIEQAPAADCFDSSDSRTLAKPQGDYVGGSVHHASWMTTPDKLTSIQRQGDVTVELRSETFQKDTSAMQAAAAGLGSLFGALLGAALSDKESSTGSLVAGALVGGLAAWGGTKKAVEGPGECRIERIETTPTGITTEKIVLDPDGTSQSYTSRFHRIGAPPEFDAEAAKEYIESLDLGPAPKQA